MTTDHTSAPTVDELAAENAQLRAQLALLGPNHRHVLETITNLELPEQWTAELRTRQWDDIGTEYYIQLRHDTIGAANRTLIAYDPRNRDEPWVVYNDRRYTTGQDAVAATIARLTALWAQRGLLNPSA